MPCERDQRGRSHPQCDTFTQSGTHASPSDRGSVGACKVSQCKFNPSSLVHYSGIDVSHLAHADCITYELRPRALGNFCS